MGQVLCADGEFSDDYKPCKTGQLKSKLTKFYPSLPTIMEEEYDDDHEMIIPIPMK